MTATQKMSLPSEVQLNDFSRAWSHIGSQAQETFDRVGSNGWYILGPEVADFEEALSVATGLSHTVGCASGLDAIEIGLRALGLEPGTRVLTTPLSAFATTLAIIRAGGQPVFVDVDEHGLLDLDLAEQAFRNDPSLRWMVPVHLYGRPLDREKLSGLKQTFGLKIIEDAAQALGAPTVGEIGQITATSFYPTKNLGCFGDGGAILTEDPKLAERCRMLRDYGQSAKYVHAELGLNSRLDELQAALLHHVMLPRLADWTGQRQATASRLLSSIRHPKVHLPQASESSVWHLFVIRTEARDDLAAHLKDQKIQTAVHYPVLIPDQPALADQHLTSAATPVARRLSHTSLSLPVHPFLTGSEIEQIIAAVNSWEA